MKTQTDVYEVVQEALLAAGLRGDITMDQYREGSRISTDCFYMGIKNIPESEIHKVIHATCKTNRHQ